MKRVRRYKIELMENFPKMIIIMQNGFLRKKIPPLF
jgi:uncharacterized protein YlzI (FlbEa/FlbD family)